MVTPLHSLFDIAIQPRKSSPFRLHRLSPLHRFLLKDTEKYATNLGNHLIREFRVTKSVNQDATLGICRILENDIEYDDDDDGDFDEDFEHDFPRQICLVFESRVAPDHAKSDGHLGPRTTVCEVILCGGRIHDNQQSFFAFALSRGKDALVKSTFEFLHKQFSTLISPSVVAPHALLRLAQTWTRKMEESEKEVKELKKAKKLRKTTQLELEFALPKQTEVEEEEEEDTVLIQVEKSSLLPLQALANEEMIPALIAHIAQNIQLDLSGAQLIRISTCTGELTRGGQVRFFWPALLPRAFQDLTRVVQQQMRRVEKTRL